MMNYNVWLQCVDRVWTFAHVYIIDGSRLCASFDTIFIIYLSFTLDIYFSSMGTDRNENIPVCHI